MAAAGDSYKLTSSDYTLDFAHGQTFHAQCGNGYYVRAGVGSAWTPGGYSGMAAVDFTDVSDSHDTIYHTGDNFGWEIPVSGLAGNRKAYQEFWIHYVNAGSSETFHFSWWCDAVPSWARTSVLGLPPNYPVITPPGPGCTYCGIPNVTLVNAATGDVLDNAGPRTPNSNYDQIITYPFTGGSNQKWAWWETLLTTTFRLRQSRRVLTASSVGEWPSFSAT